MDNNSKLAVIDAALFDAMKVAKRPRYWDEFQRRVGSQIDRPTAAILRLLSAQSLQFRDLVTKLGIEAPSISRKVHELEQEGLIERSPTEDRRVHILSLSNEGKSLARKIIDARFSILNDTLISWSENDKAKLSELLSRLAKDLSNQYGSKDTACHK